MAVTYGFYNSNAGDRRYNTLQISRLFDGVIQDGVFMSIGEALIVKPNSGMNIMVGKGRAWFEHSWTDNDADYVLTVEAPDLLFARWDAVVLETNSSLAVRANSFKIIKGVASATPVLPTLIHTAEVNQHPLAWINVGVGVSVISSANIINAVGTSACPFVTGAVQSFNIDALIAQWGGQWSSWLAAKGTEWTSWLGSRLTEFNTWLGSRLTEFNTWLGSRLADFNSWLDDRESDFNTWLADKNAEFEILAADRTYYVSTSGNDGNDGLTAGTPFRLIQHAIDVATNMNLMTHNITIQLAAGMYTESVLLKPFVGVGRISIQGNQGNPDGYVINTSGASCFRTGVVDGGGAYSILGMMLNTNSGNCIDISRNFRIIIMAINFASAATAHIQLTDGAELTAGSYKVTGPADFHWSIINRSFLSCQGITITLPVGPVPIDDSWLYLTTNSVGYVNGITFVNKENIVTAKRYNVNTNGVVISGSADPAYLPGPVAGTTATGGQYV